MTDRTALIDKVITTPVAVGAVSYPWLEQHITYAASLSKDLAVIVGFLYLLARFVAFLLDRFTKSNPS